MLLAIPRLKVDVFGQIKELLGRKNFVIPEQVLEELEKISRKSKKNQKEIFMIKQIMRNNNVKTIKGEGNNADESLEKLAEKGIITATNDARLRKKIKRLGRNIYLKKRKIITLENF